MYPRRLSCVCGGPWWKFPWTHPLRDGSEDALSLPINGGENGGSLRIGAFSLAYK